MSQITIEIGELKTVVELSQQIPEFDNPHLIQEYNKRLNNRPNLILIAKCDGNPVAFKVAYERDSDGSLYSWMGGVLPEFRRKGIAQLLADAQEKWAAENAYSSIRFKTRNRHQKMLLFAIGNGFKIIDLIKVDDLNEYRIVLEKKFWLAAKL